LRRSTRLERFVCTSIEEEAPERNPAREAHRTDRQSLPTQHFARVAGMETNAPYSVCRSFKLHRRAENRAPNTRPWRCATWYTPRH
jgi:hypothetical protein